jgi:histidyl-tRNA synthetase
VQSSSVAATSLNNSEVGNMGKKTPQFRLKTPKGTKDCRWSLAFFSPLLRWYRRSFSDSIVQGDGKDIVIRDQIFSSITKVLKRHGAVTIDTYVSDHSFLAQHELQFCSPS